LRLLQPNFDGQERVHGFEVRLGHRQLKAPERVETVVDDGTVGDSLENFPALKRA
jgi:hypothetical protein